MKNTIRHLRDILKVRYFINTSKEEKQFKTTINRYLNAWKSETIKKFNNKIEKNLIKKDIDPKDIEAIANFKIGSIDKRLASLGVAAAQKGLERAYLDMNTILSWDIDMTPIADYYLQHYKEFTNVVTKDIQDRIRNIISDGVKEGKTNETLSKEISDTFDNPIIVTVPDNYHTTLDELGYGPYSSITYAKPDFEKVNKQEADNFFNTTVNNWIKSKETKWAGRFENNVIEITDKDYYLVLGQCFGDEVVTRHDFGVYYIKLESIVKELARLTNNLIIVKLHPYTDGNLAKDTIFSEEIKAKLEKLGNNIKVYIGKSNVHNFIENAKCIILANSGAGFEAMMHHKPIITWGFPEYHWVTYDLRHLADLGRAIKLDWFDKEKQDKFLYWYMEIAQAIDVVGMVG